jgi:hypothetical protein
MTAEENNGTATDAMLEIAQHLASLSASTLRLHVGELTAAEMRAVRAVLHWQAMELLKRTTRLGFEPVQTIIQTGHFHGREMPLTAVLFALAGQEGNDGDEGNAMQAAGEALVRLQHEVGRLRTMIRVNTLRWNPAATNEDIDRVIDGRDTE